MSSRADPAPDAAQVRRTVEAVDDPELPPVTLGMLGMVHDVRVDDDTATVVLLPTVLGCPALEMMERDVAAAVAALPGVGDVRVRFAHDPPWHADRITAEGHAALRSYGIAPPGGDLPDVPRPEGRMALPLARTPVSVRPCPWCGSHDTVQDAAFGPTPCRDLRWCERCAQPFEAFRDL